MAIFKCKMCGGTLEINNNETVAVCEYCGTKQTLPKLDDERKANLYDRANHFRRNNEFDKAMGIYEQILNDDNTDAESYWSLVLCRYGIEYVEDPKTHKRIPTVNRAQYTSVFADEDYKSAIQYADASQREIYEAEAKTIDEIQKGILAISQKEEPFDVFICYKESDVNGRRTPDSVIATELYHELTRDGYKVFFARITLEDKLGEEYEPYIFAALNSSKVMVVLGTKPEHFNAVWVKNEWSRYLTLIKNGARKMLVPAYRDMDPYDLPEEFSHLQALDMSKLGFMQDLVRGISKVVDSSRPTVKETVVVNSNNAQIEPLLKRIFMFLEDGDFGRADEFCEQVLNIDPECAEAYLGKLMINSNVKKQDDLGKLNYSFTENANYQKALRFADSKLKSQLDEYATLCNEIVETKSKDLVLNEAKSYMTGNDISTYESAINLFETIRGWKDADEQITVCQNKIEEIKVKEETDRLEREREAEIAREEAERRAKRNKKIVITATSIVAILIAFIIVLNTIIIPNIMYNNAMKLIDTENLDEAYNILKELGDYKDSVHKVRDVRLAKTKEQFKNIKVGDYIILGEYEQDNDTTNGAEDIEWLVLDVKDGKALVISKYAIDCMPYSTTNFDITWATCSIRVWLNNNFLDSYFSVDEQSIIPTVTVFADRNPEHNTNPGASTQDKIFLLSIKEVNEYFNTDFAKQCEPTAYAVARGAMKNSNGYCWWWLRTPGASRTYAATVNYFGFVSEYGDFVDYEYEAVRPAMWIELE